MTSLKCALGPYPSSDGECRAFLNRLLSEVQRTYYVFETGDRTQSVSAETATEFITSGSMAPKDHCMSTKCRPDLVAVLKSHSRPSPNRIKGQGASDTSASASATPADPTTPIPDSNTTAIKPPPVEWANLEAVVVYHSNGASVDDNIKQAVAYTGYLLAARPDRVTFQIAVNGSVHKNYSTVLVSDSWALDHDPLSV